MISTIGMTSTEDVLTRTNKCCPVLRSEDKCVRWVSHPHIDICLEKMCTLASTDDTLGPLLVRDIYSLFIIYSLCFRGEASAYKSKFLWIKPYILSQYPFSNSQ